MKRGEIVEAGIDRALGAALRWTMLGFYVVSAAVCCHDGTSASDFAFLLVAAAMILPFVLLSDWIAAGRPAGDWGDEQ